MTLYCNDISTTTRSIVKNSGYTVLPGHLESENMWKQREEKFINYKISYMGENGVPLSYVIW